MAEQVIRTFDLYNTSVLLPGYTIPEYENEFGVTRAFYSTDFSSNPIGSKLDFFAQLDDPCVGVLSANPIFAVPIGLSAMNPLWFDQWWDEAMFYSHPKVLEQLMLSNPQTFQEFSDSVGTNFFIADENSPVNPSLNNKIPRNLLQQMSKLNKLINIDFKAFTPPGIGPNTTKYTAQLNQFTNSIANVKNIVNEKFANITRKLPMNVQQVGNLITPANWKFNTAVQGVKTAVDRLGNIINAPGRALSAAVNKIKSLIPVIRLPSLSKLVGAIMPNMPAISNLVKEIKEVGAGIQAAVATAQGAMAQVQGAIAAGKEAIGAVQSAVNDVKGTVQGIGNNIAAVGNSLSNIRNGVDKNNIMAAMKNQSKSAVSGLNNNALVLVNKTAKTSKGENSLTPVSTFNYKKPT